MIMCIFWFQFLNLVTEIFCLFRNRKINFVMIGFRHGMEKDFRLLHKLNKCYVVLLC
jgi:hypothetical protein